MKVVEQKLKEESVSEDKIKETIISNTEASIESKQKI